VLKDQLKQEYQIYLQKKQNSSYLTKLNEQIKEIEKEIQILKEPLDNELAKLLENFVEINKILIKDKDNKKIKDNAKELHKALEKKGFLKENIEKVIICCEKSVDLEAQKEWSSENNEEFQAKIEALPKK